MQRNLKYLDNDFPVVFVIVYPQKEKNSVNVESFPESIMNINQEKVAKWRL